MKPILFGSLIWTVLAVSAQGASFDCAKAKSKVEVAICQNAGLSQEDSELNNRFRSLHDKYDGLRQKSLVDGQLKWLHLRDQACLVGDAPTTGEGLQSCLLSVYKERSGEIEDEIKLYDYYKRNGIASSSNIEKELDSVLETDTLSHHPANPIDDDPYLPDAEYDAKSCREFFTLTSGLWAIENFRGGDAREMQGTKNGCSFTFYSKQIISVKNEPSVDFSDTSLYSREVMCGESDNCGAKSFGMMIKDKELSEVSPNHNVYAKNSNTDLFRADKNGFVYETKGTETGENYSFTLSKVGNFTNQGREEAVVLMVRMWGTGSETSVLLFYYDPATKSIRPEKIESSNRFSPMVLVEHK